MHVYSDQYIQYSMLNRSIYSRPSHLHAYIYSYIACDDSQGDLKSDVIMTLM